jgi:hypothetical protein
VSVSDAPSMSIRGLGSVIVLCGHLVRIEGYELHQPSIPRLPHERVRADALDVIFS